MAVWTALIEPVVGFFTQRSKRKQARETAQAKLKQAKADNNFKLELTDQEWEALGKAAEGGSWKDEYVTVVITMPLLAVFFCAMATVLLGNPIYMTAATEGTKAIKSLLPSFGTVLEVVVYAAVSIKGIGQIVK